MGNADEMAARARVLAAAARALGQAGGALAARAPFSLAFLTDARRGPDPLAVAQALPCGAAVLLRDYDDPARENRARALREACAARGLVFIVGGDVALAGRVGADGAHLRAGQLAAPPQTARGLLLTAAAHNAEELALAARLGTDAAFLSPVYVTASHPGARPLGPARFRALAARAALPVLALGGVDETSAGELAGENVAGFGAIGAFAPR